jgi:hypothetical protein
LMLPLMPPLAVMALAICAAARTTGRADDISEMIRLDIASDDNFHQRAAHQLTAAKPQSIYSLRSRLR